MCRPFPVSDLYLSGVNTAIIFRSSRAGHPPVTPVGRETGVEHVNSIARFFRGSGRRRFRGSRQFGPGVEGRDRLPATGIVWDAEGLILTAHHILERDENINVGFHDGETVAAELLGRDPATDLALLRTPRRGASAPFWA